MLVTLIDSPYSNAANIARALRHVGAELTITRNAGQIAAAGKLVLPGVGSFGTAMSWLREHGIDGAIGEAVTRGAAILGICVGHQLLFAGSSESGSHRGLGLVDGEIVRFEGLLPVPQIGWNRVHVAHDSDSLFAGIAEGTSFYFVNSYAARSSVDESANAEYDGSFTAAVHRDRVFGVQFHPEKSSDAGLQVLRSFVEKVQ